MHCPHLMDTSAAHWRKTASYYLLHMAIASIVAYAVTGSLATALSLSLLEPAVQAVAYFFHDKAWSRVGPLRARTLRKTASYALLHMAVATVVAYAVTGDWEQALTLSLLEPAVQMLFFYLHEKRWERRLQPTWHAA